MMEMRKKVHHLADEVKIMGIVNCTPDSFSDGGLIDGEASLMTQVEEMVDAGVHIIDIGGESSRPFADPVSVEEELDRVLPAIRAVRGRYATPISIDTTKAEVARQAIEAGADIINDISALSHDPAMIDVARGKEVPVIIMHMQGTPRSMQINPRYDDVVAEVKAELAARIAWAEERGLPRQRLIIDPGLGFGKSVEHNLTILRELDRFTELGCPLLVGHSRKSFIGKILSLDDPAGRDEATAVISAYCAMQGAAIVRVHDVRRTAQAIRMLTAISLGRPLENEHR